MGENEADHRDKPGRVRSLDRGLHRLGVLAYFAIVAGIAISYALFALSRGTDVTVKPSAIPRAPLPPNRVELLVEPISIDAASGEGQVEVIPKLVGDLGVPFGNTSEATVPIRLTIDGAQPPTEEVSAGEVLAVSKPTVLLGNSASLTAFPFDSYTAHLYASAERTGSPRPIPIPVVLFPTPESVSGYDIAFSGVSAHGDSDSVPRPEMILDITRDDDVQAVTVLVGIISLVSAAVVLMLTTLVVLGKKANKIDGTIVMTAVIPFALILLREVIPDAPPVGVDYDIYVYYSSVIAAFLAFIVCVTEWLINRGSDRA
jgi:hypothetical protein